MDLSLSPPPLVVCIIGNVLPLMFRWVIDLSAYDSEADRTHPQRVHLRATPPALNARQHQSVDNCQLSVDSQHW